MEILTWQLVVVILGGVTSLLAFFYAMLNKNKKDTDPWRSDMDKNSAVITEQIHNIKREMTDLKDNISTGDERTRRTFEKFEKKIESLTNIIIEHIRNDSTK